MLEEVPWISDNAKWQTIVEVYQYRNLTIKLEPFMLKHLKRIVNLPRVCRNFPRNSDLPFYVIIFNGTWPARSYPITSHDTFPKSPVAPHFSYDCTKSLISWSSVLALHPHFKHLHCNGSPRNYTFLTRRLNAPGLARMALAAPAIAPAAAISFRERFGKGDIIRLEVP